MEKSRNTVSYSIIRYSPDEVKGEVINVGVILHNLEEKQAKYYMLDETSSKLKALTENKIEIDTYKSFKDTFEYYLEKSKDDLSGVVGNISIASYYDSDFLNKLFENYNNCNLFLAKPSIAYTKNVNMFFKSILNRYVGEKNINKEVTTMTAKKYMKKIFEETKLLGPKIKADMFLNPIDNLKDLKVKVDFTFKNGVWNYMQTIPSSNSPTKNSEWFAKSQLIIDMIKNKEAKLHLLYKNSDFEEDKTTIHLLDYLKLNNNNKISTLDIDKKDNVENLCKYIDEQAEIIDKEAV